MKCLIILPSLVTTTGTDLGGEDLFVPGETSCFFKFSERRNLLLVDVPLEDKSVSGVAASSLLFFLFFEEDNESDLSWPQKKEEQKKRQTTK